MSVYLFDMDGGVIAFRRTWTDPFVFDTHGHWLGWFPWDDHDALDPHGDYLGTIVGDRLVRRNDWCLRAPVPPAPADPGPASPQGTPPAPHHFHNRFAYEDVRISHLA